MKLHDLIDQAASKAGSDYKLAKAIGQPPQRVSDWRHGRTTCSPEDQALMASVAGLDPEDILIRAILAKHADTPKGERLLSVLGNVLRRTGEAATTSFFASVALVLALLGNPTPSDARGIGPFRFRR